MIDDNYLHQFGLHVSITISHVLITKLESSITYSRLEEYILIRGEPWAVSLFVLYIDSMEDSPSIIPLAEWHVSGQQPNLTCRQSI